MRTLWISTACVAVLATTPAFAQLGGIGGGLRGPLGGSVGGSVGGAASGALGGAAGSLGSSSSATGSAGAQGSVPGPNVGGAVGTARDTVQGARGVAGGVVNDARGVANSANASAQGSVSANANGSASGSASNNGASGAASGYAGINVGMNLVSNTGQTIGQIVDIVRNRAGQVTSLTVQTADGLRRSVPPAGVSAQGNLAVTNYSSAEFNRLPRVASASAATALSSNVNANVGASTMSLMDRSGHVLGRVISVARNASGRVTSAVIETSDGVQRILPGGQLTIDGSVATTSRTDAQLHRLRKAQ